MIPAAICGPGTVIGMCVAKTGGISVVVPVFNSEGSIEELVSRLQRVMTTLHEQFEIVLVNDGSRDASWETIRRLSCGNQVVRGINLMRNYGQHNALLCGIRAARFAITVTLDDDLQNPPEEVPRLLVALGPDHDVVYGAPLRNRHGAWRGLAGWVTKLALQAAMGAETARKVSSFRAFRTELRLAFADLQGPFVCIDVLLTWATTRFGVVQVEHRERQVGESNYTFGTLLTHALNMMTGYSTIPLQLASVLGFSLTAFGGLVLAYVLGRYLLQGGAVPGFPFLASIIAVFSGAQLFSLGIIGEYLARIHFRVMDRPSYAVRQQVGDDGRVA